MSGRAVRSGRRSGSFPMSETFASVKMQIGERVLTCSGVSDVIDNRIDAEFEGRVLGQFWGMASSRATARIWQQLSSEHLEYDEGPDQISGTFKYVGNGLEACTLEVARAGIANKVLGRSWNLIRSRSWILVLGQLRYQVLGQVRAQAMEISDE
jgi:hypothetical protein